MKILGIDFGTKNIGVAVSDETATFSFPRAVLKNDDKIFVNLNRIISEEKISKIVVGDPGENGLSSQVKIFVTELESQFDLEVFSEKEFMTSAHVSQASGKKPVARQIKKETGLKRDDSAAALILQRYLDKNKFKN
jgi:putative Holliday junction resolvase